MCVTQCTSSMPSFSDRRNDAVEEGVPWNCHGRMMCWMNLERMTEVGVTAGVKKVISAVHEHRNPTAKPRGGNKRKKDLSVEAGQSKLSSFFTKKVT